MKVLIIDAWGGDGMLDIVLRMQDAGHAVRWFFHKTDRNENYGRGLTQRVADWRDHWRWADLVVLADNTKYLREIDSLRKADKNKRVIGATNDAAKWELDRDHGQKVFKRAGIPVPPFREFSDYPSAIAYVKRENRAFVCKPSYDEPDKSLSYVAKSPADLVYMLERWQKAKRHKGPFILQEKISGCEMAVGNFFGRHGFSPGWCENWEFKALMAGDRGPNVGEMGTVLRFVTASKLADKVLKPLEDRIAATGHTGYVDVNCIIDDKGDPWPLEFTMRFGWPTFNIQQALLQEDCAEWLADLCDGRSSRPFKLDTVSTGVVMALPEFPYGKTPLDKVTGVPVYGLDKAAVRRRVHPCELMQGRNIPCDVNGQVVNMDCLLSAGEYLLVVSGTGDSVRSSRGKAYRTLDEIKAPASPFWRPDIGQRLKEQLPMIQTHGYARGLNF